MSNAVSSAEPAAGTTSANGPDLSAARLRKRYAAEKRFRLYGITAVLIAVAMLAVLLGDIVLKGYSAFWQTHIQLDVTFTESVVDPEGTRDPEQIKRANYNQLVYDSLFASFPQLDNERQREDLRRIPSGQAGSQLRSMVVNNPDLVGTTQQVWVKTDDLVDMLHKGYVDMDAPDERRMVDARLIEVYEELAEAGRVESQFNVGFFTGGDSREPEMAGILGATVGSFLTLAVTLVLSFPIAVLAAVYLEEFAPKNKFTDFIEININNLAAVPSIVFGLLGLAVFINFFGLPRSAPLVGGMVLTLMTLPTIIISSRSALKAVPPSIREGALAVGASRIQTITHHVLPLAMPGMLTGTIIGMAQALGETAPLLLIGMVAFITGTPSGFTDASTVLPVQVFLWASSPERAFIEKTSAAIMVLLAFLIVMNLTAVILRKRFERRW
ncbi:phosphate ABC transporter membrane protein 2, PhoT family [Limimonas halophila]|uniref:Phosphate transport system permease protein PstA n=1 Tax=Limimonas halophila TaxID=1082479 RepID=A0A1G7S6U9_9PROT|nr:phosphate ABC transporter permease PstA [Limimonas halophila]SDG18209.1 phosphate ABC transporter membrane protein 2, PhoT family [Limimonas halophila]